MTGQSSSIELGKKQDSAVAWIAITACVLFALPLVAMQFTAEFDWKLLDFVVWGALLAAAGSAFVWARRRLPRSKWLGAGALIGAVFVYVWAELAVGIFTSLGS